MNWAVPEQERKGSSLVQFWYTLALFTLLYEAK
jgi:hypothetical protein